MNSDRMTAELYTILDEELKNRAPYLSLRTLSERDRQRQGLALTNSRYFIAILENHIFERTESVVFTIEVTESFYVLRFSRILPTRKYDQIMASNYAPLMCSRIRLSVGLGRDESIHYAWAEIRLSPYSSIIDLFDAIFALGKELEKYLTNTNKNIKERGGGHYYERTEGSG